ncbi:MAG: hypothetical protein J6J60_09075 [Clostridia bacterium]|nr:hypothetical protein [Clostridia bacterium]
MINDFLSDNDIVNKVSNELSEKNENVYVSILSLKEEINNFAQKNNELQNKLFDIENVNLESKNTQILFKENPEMEKVKILCTQLKDKIDRISDVFSKENEIYKNKVMSDFEEVKNISKEFNKFISINEIENLKMIQNFNNSNEKK